MSNKNTQADDTDLIYFFKHFETILIDPKKQDIEAVSTRIDFCVFSEYLIDDIRKIQQRLSSADDEYLLYVCRHVYNIIDWFRLIAENRSKVFSEAFERVFNEHFGDTHILQSIYNTSLERWMTDKRGQHQLGANTYSVIDDKLYYRDRFCEWSQVYRETAFDLQPSKEPIKDQAIIEQLNREYEETSYDILIKNWGDRDYKGVLPDDFLRFDKETTNPEEYFDFTMDHIKLLLDNPVSIKELERWNGGEIRNLEDTVKLCAMALDIVKKRRKDNSHTVYLLRDCMVFCEIHKTIDILNSEETSSDQLMIGRKLLSHKPDQWGYYIVILEALYEAHKRYPNNFSEFYNEFARLLDLFASINPKFMAIIDDLAVYIKKHIQTSKNKVVIFDVGFQGSINLFIKYIIDRHINSSSPKDKIETEIELSVGAEWSKELFESRVKGDYFPFLNHIQLMARSDELYHYKFGSLNSGKVQVVMGDNQWQRKAAVELVVLVMITQLAHTEN